MYFFLILTKYVPVSNSVNAKYVPEVLVLILSVCLLDRLMRPDDANIVGNVHGGTILKMIEEAGCIIGTRHCNTQPGVSMCV